MQNIIVQKIKQSERFTLYQSKMSVYDLFTNGIVLRRGEDSDGIQRQLEEKRAAAIESFAKDEDAVFATSIVLSISSDVFESTPLIVQLPPNERILEFDDDSLFQWNFIETGNKNYFRIIDGQHRIDGLRRAFESSRVNPDLSVIFIVDASLYDEAYVFSTINSNQKSVSKSLIFDLFDDSISDDGFVKDSLEGTVHYMIRWLNEATESAFFGRVKMLGRKTNQKQWISQGTMGTEFMKLISNNSEKDNRAMKYGRLEFDYKDASKFPLRELWIHHAQNTMSEIMQNYFDAFSESFPYLWDEPISSVLNTHAGGPLAPVVEKFGDDQTVFANTQKTLGFMILTKFFAKMAPFLDYNFKKENFIAQFEQAANTNPSAFYEIFTTKGSGESIAEENAKRLFSIWKGNKEPY